MKLVVHSGAHADYLGAIARFKAASRARGVAFAIEFRRTLAGIAEYPQSYSADDRGVRKCQFQKFPFLVYYRIDEDVIEIIAVAHTSREPYYWRDRL
jgi:plasmid stabilization system protein ParE